MPLHIQRGEVVGGFDRAEAKVNHLSVLVYVNRTDSHIGLHLLQRRPFRPLVIITLRQIELIKLILEAIDRL